MKTLILSLLLFFGFMSKAHALPKSSVQDFKIIVPQPNVSILVPVPVPRLVPMYPVYPIYPVPIYRQYYPVYPLIPLYPSLPYYPIYPLGPYYPPNLVY